MDDRTPMMGRKSLYWITRVAAVLVMALIVSGFLATAAFAVGERWYVGDYRDRGYGVKAAISTPASRPYMRLYDPDGTASRVFHYVSNYGTENPDQWVQTGYYIDGTDAYAWSYYEYPNGSGVTQVKLPTKHYWNFTRTYEVKYGADSKWHVYVNGREKGTGWSNGGVPQVIYATSESTNTDNDFSVDSPASYPWFNNVNYKSSTTYYLFETQGYWDWEYPPPNGEDVVHYLDTPTPNPWWQVWDYPYK